VKLHIVEDGKLVAYERLGNCKKCGKCCRKKITFTWEILKADEAITREDSEKADWSHWEGYSVIYARGVYWYFKVTSIKDPKPDDERIPCRRLEGNLCSIHEDQHQLPPLCPLWPVHPKDLLPGCGYSFILERI